MSHTKSNKKKQNIFLNYFLYTGDFFLTPTI